MPRKELGAPSEDRRKAEKLFYDAEGTSKIANPDHGCDDSDFFEDDGGVSSLIKAKKRKTASQYAMALVSVKSYTEHAIREKLKSRAYSPNEIDEAVAYVKKFGYINDLRLAQNAAERLAQKPCGKRKIFSYLRQKGIQGQVIDEIDLSEIDFKENARAYAEKLALKGKTKEQIIRSLVSLGFSASEISFAANIDFDFNSDEE